MPDFLASATMTGLICEHSSIDGLVEIVNYRNWLSAVAE